MKLLQDKNRKYRRYGYGSGEKIKLANYGLQWVLSSNVSAIGVAGDDLIVRFHNGSLYQYDGKGDEYQKMLSSNSKGHWVWAKLRKPKVPYKKIGSLPLADDELATDEEVFRLVDDAGIALEQRLRAMGVFIADFNNMNLGLTSLMDLLK